MSQSSAVAQICNPPGDMSVKGPMTTVFAEENARSSMCPQGTALAGKLRHEDVEVYQNHRSTFDDVLAQFVECRRPQTRMGPYK